MLWCCENFVPLGQLIAISMPRQAHEHSRDFVVNITITDNFEVNLGAEFTIE